MADLSGQSFGRYNLLERLGEGGMATVYKAFDTRLETHVAVKVIRTETLAPTVLERALKRFEREAKSLARLTHPNIVKVTDYGEYDGKPFLVMTYLPGGTLKQRLGQPIPWQEAARTLLPIARALDYAHRQNMIHRDVKPSNILFTTDSEPMLTDFGIAKILDLEETADLTGTGMGIGTPEYMAPEQWTGRTTQQSDQYSLGVVFYEMLTARKPYTADTPAAILLKQANEPLTRPSQFARGLPGKVEKILFKAMAKGPIDRYPNMGAFAKALESFLVGEAAPVQPQVIPAHEPIHPQAEPRREQVIPRPAAKVGQVPPQPAAKLEPSKKMIEITAEEKKVRVIPHVPSTARAKQRSSLLRFWPVMGGVLLVILCTLILANLPWKIWFAPPLPPLSTVTTIPSLPEAITDSRGVTMRLIPAGTFTMGSENGKDDEKPGHEVYLDSFYMDIYEATNEQYRACLAAGVCDNNFGARSYTRPSYSQDREFDDYPVINVPWSNAKTFCEWRGARLPTEAEWEKATRGMDGRTYPWGEENIDCDKSNFRGCFGDTTSVGSLPNGASPYGVYDTIGNVWEWVTDWYSESFYLESPLENPLGPAIGTYHVLRGGSWLDEGSGLRASIRRSPGPNSAGNNVGFRCAHSADDSVLNMASQPVVATPPPTATAIPTQASTIEDVVDSQGVTMRLIPAGTFTMGSDSGNADEKPVHEVYLDAYYMDIYEVTNKLYKACVDAGTCKPPIQNNSYSRSSYFGNSEFDNFPVTYVDWDMANTYCEWRGGGVPTEAQWEKAARGTDNRTYPWGEKVDCTRANYSSCKGETSAVGSFVDGASPYGLFDMAGNVLEWVADWYDTAYYKNSPLSNPPGPLSGKRHVLRGGSWKSIETGIRSSARLAITPDATNYYLIGFRCTRPVP